MSRSPLLLALASILALAGCASEERPPSVLERLPNGLTVIVREDEGDDVVSVQAWVRDGSLFETAAESGQAFVLARSLASRSESGDAGGPARAVAGIGGRLSFVPGHDNVHVMVTAPSRHFDRALDALAAAVVGTELEAGDVERAKADAASTLEALSGRPIDRALLLCLRAMAGDHALARAVPGNPSVVASLEAAGLAARHARFYVGNNAAVIVVGNVDAQTAADKVARAFGDLPAGERAELAGAPVDWPESPVYAVEKADVGRAYVVMAFPGPGVKDPDHVAVDVLMMALANGRASILSRALVDERSLAGSVGGGWYTRERPSPCLVWMELPPENAAAAEQTVVEIVESLAGTRLTAQDLERGKSLLRSVVAFQMDTCEQQAAYQGYWHTVAGEGYADTYDSSIGSVTLEDLRNAAAKYLRPRSRATAVLEPEWVR